MLPDNHANKSIRVSLLSGFGIPVTTGFLLVLPFIYLEVVNRHSYQEAFPWPLFAVMGALPALFLIILFPCIKNIRRENKSNTTLINIAISGLFLTVIALLWAGILYDQMPCFLGFPNCD